MGQSTAREGGFQSRVCTSTLRLARWTGIWVAATALMSFGPRFLWNKDLALTLLALGLNIAFGIGWIWATKGYIAELDELQRKVYLDALAITLGVAAIVAIPYSILDSYIEIPFRADIGHLVILMSLTFVASFLYGTKRYQ